MDAFPVLSNMSNDKVHFSVDVVDFEEKRDIRRVADADGNTLELVPVEGSETFRIKLRMPNRSCLWVNVAKSDYEAVVVPTLHVSIARDARGLK